MVETSEPFNEMPLPRNLNADYERAADFLFATPGPTINVFAAHHKNGKVYGRTFEKTAPDRASLIDWMKRGQVRGFNLYYNINGLKVRLDLIKKATEGARLDCLCPAWRLRCVKPQNRRGAPQSAPIHKGAA